MVEDCMDYGTGSDCVAACARDAVDFGVEWVEALE